MTALRGGCFCGAVRYETAGKPFNESVCHCSMCRRASGAPFVAWFSVPSAQFKFVSGEPARFRSSATAVRGFCAQCGTALTFQLDAHPEEIDVTIASLDDPGALRPKDHIYTSTKLDWVKLADGLPQFKASRAD